MTTAAGTEPLIRDVRVTRSEIVAHLADGRVISVPLAWSWRLSDATPAQRANFRLIGAGQGIHWPDVDEDISVEGMLQGSPAPRPRTRPLHGAEPARRKVPKPKKAANPPMRRTAGSAGRR
jgi:hypothetical protein